MTQSDIINNNFSKAFECIKCSNAYDTGEVLSEEKLFKQISERKHSTFDLSKFTVVGSLTITDDGVASGFSNSSYLTKSFNKKISSNFELYIKLKDLDYNNNRQNFLILFIANYYYAIYIENNGFLTLRVPNENGSSFTEKTCLNTNYYKGKDLYLKYEVRNKKTVTLSYSDNGNDYIVGTTITFVNDNTYLDLENIYKIGGISNTSYIGSIDLKNFSITVDGKEVFSGNKTGIDVINEIEIPYTLSKTGSKIVDVAYRDRVIDLYEQEGKATYYTIDETNKNFTLPMGEIYGMIGGSSSTGGSGLEICDIGMALYVDETKGLRRYLNGQIVDINTNTQAFLNRLQQIATLHPSLLCTEEEWQTEKTMSVFGQVGKFVFNYSGDEIVSVRLPRVVNVQGLFDLQNLGMTVKESLPNIKGGYTVTADISGNISQVTGAFNGTTDTEISHYGGGSGDLRNAKVIFNAHNSSPTYQDNAPVQQEAIQYPYFIQIATGSETENNIINEIELNNPYSLFDSKYSDHELNNLSWLKSEGQWNAKAVYPTAYDKLLKVYNGTETVEGLSVKLNTETYTDYDFVLNTADETFRLPLKTKLASGKAIVGNGKSFGLTNGTVSGSLLMGLSVSGSQYYAGMAGTFGEVGSHTPAITMAQDTAVGVTTDPTKSGIELSDSGLYLYYYVGETVQNANLIDAGRINEQLSDLVEVGGSLGMPSNKYVNLTLGASGDSYTAPANGYFYINKIAGSDWYYVRMRNAISNIDLFVDAYRTTPLTSVIPAKKGENVYVYYNATGTTNDFRFIYAQGDV